MESTTFVKPNVIFFIPLSLSSCPHDKVQTPYCGFQGHSENFWGIHPVHESQVPFLWESFLLPSRVGLPGTIFTKMWPWPLAIVDWTRGGPMMGAVPTRNVTSRTGTGTTELFSPGVWVCFVQTLVLWTGQVSQRLDWPEFLSEKRKKETFLSAERRVKYWSMNTAWAHHDLPPSFSLLDSVMWSCL